MKTKKILIFALFIIGILLLISYSKNASKNYKTEIFKTNNGYGYNIRVNNKVLIKQVHIPAVQNKKSFCNKLDASKVANFMIEKLQHKKNPSITILELQQLNISLNCN